MHHINTNNVLNVVIILPMRINQLILIYMLIKIFIY